MDGLIAMAGGVLQVIGALGATGAVAGAAAWWLFKQFGQGWLKVQFDKDLAEFKASKDRELEHLRAEIGRLADRATRFHAREYKVLPRAWGALNRAHGAVHDAVRGLQQLPNLERMSPAKFEEFLAESDLPESDREALRSDTDRNGRYAEIDKWKRISAAHKAQAEYHNYLILQNIFIEDDIAKKMSVASVKLRTALFDLRWAEEGQGEMYRAAGKAMDEVDSLVIDIKADVRKRLSAIKIES